MFSNRLSLEKYPIIERKYSLIMNSKFLNPVVARTTFFEWTRY